MFYPVLARTPCEECCKYVIRYDWLKHEGSGEREIDEATGEPMERDGPPPCKEGRRSSTLCPKECPEKEKEHVLSEKNYRAWNFYREVRAAGLPEEMKTDRVLMKNLALIDHIVRDGEQYQLAKRTALHIAARIA